MNRRILLIDADPEFRANLAQQLARYRFDIVVEPDAEEALGNAATQPPALIVLAVDEPEKAGFKVFQRLRKGPLSKTPIVLATSSVSPESFAKHRTLKIHADEYVDKRTLGKDELLGKLDNLIGLGDHAEDDLDIPVEIDDIALHDNDNDMVLDETVGEDDAAHPMDGGAAQSAADARMDQMVSAETDAAFDALMGGFGDEPAHIESPPPVAEEPSHVAAPIHADSVPAPVHDGKRFDPDDDTGFDTFSRESNRPPIVAVEELPSEVRAAVTRYESQPAIMLDSDDLQPVEDDSGGVPEPVPHVNLVTREEEAVPDAAPPKFLDSPTMADAPRVRAVVDLGLDAIAMDAESEQSGVYDRKALRKIGELERQISQLKTELDRQRATADSSARGASREREFLTLREQIIARDRDLQRAKSDLATRDRELADAEERLKQAQQARMALEGKSAELEQRLAADGTRVDSLESRERSLAAQLASVQHDLETRTQALAAAESARAQTERDLISERTTRAASASDAERALRVEREQMIARHQGELGSLRLEHAGSQAIALEKQRQEHVATHATALDALRREHGAAIDVSRQQLEAARQQHATTLEAQREELAAQHAGILAAAVETTRQEIATEADQAVSQLEAQHARDLASLKDDHGSVLERLAQERDNAIARAVGERDEAIERARNEHAAAIEQHKRELAAALERQQHEHATTIDNTRAEHAEALEQQQRDHAGEMTRLAEDHAGTQEQYAAALAKQEADHAAELARLRDELGGQVAGLSAARDRAVAEAAADRDHARAELAAAKAAHGQALALQADQLANELVEQANQHAEAMTARERELMLTRQDEAIANTAALAELKAELDRQAATHGIKLDGAKKELDDVLALHAQSKSQLLDDHNRVSTEQAAAHAAELARIEEEKQRVAEERQRAIDDMQRAQSEHRAALERTTAQHRDELAQQKDLADREMTEYRSALVSAKRTMEDTAAKHQAEREASDQAHAQALADQKAQHERAIAVVNGEVVKVKAFGDAEHNRAMAAKEAEHDRQRKEAAAESSRTIKDLTSERDELSRGLSAARDTIKRSETELGSAVQTIADRNSELRSHAAAITERDQRIAELRKEIETLEAENSSYQEQVLRAYQKLKADEAMVARAKKAMAIALTVLDDQGNPKTDA